MPKLTVGTQMPDFTFDTPFESGRTLAETAGKTAGKTALVFLRYYGCTLCQYDIHEFAIQHDMTKSPPPAGRCWWCFSPTPPSWQAR